MLNPFKEVQWRPNLEERRKFGVSFMIGFPSIAIVLWLGFWLFAESTPTETMLRIGGFGFLAGLLFRLIPWIATPFYQLWYSIACIMGLVIGNTALSLIYVILFGLVGFLSRNLRRDFFRKKFDRDADTYWEDAKPVLEPRRYYKQY